MKTIILFSSVLIGFGICSNGWTQVEAFKQKELMAKQRQARIEYRSKQQEENFAFRESLTGKTEKEKKELLKKHNEKLKTEQKNFQRTMHQENMAYLKDSLARNPYLKDTEKKDLLKSVDDAFVKSLTKKDSPYIENVLYYEKILNDNTVSLAKKKKAIKDYINGQKEKKLNASKRKDAGTKFIPLKAGQTVPSRAATKAPDPAQPNIPSKTSNQSSR